MEMPNYVYHNRSAIDHNVELFDKALSNILRKYPELCSDTIDIANAFNFILNHVYLPYFAVEEVDNDVNTHDIVPQ